MKNSILADIRAAAGLFPEIRKARKNGYALEVVQYKQLPIIRSGGFYNTVEGCTLSNCGEEIASRAQNAFDRLPEESKRLLQFSPKRGEFIDRAELWAFILRAELTPNQYHIAMSNILDWYIHIKRMGYDKA